MIFRMKFYHKMSSIRSASTLWVALALLLCTLALHPARLVAADASWVAIAETGLASDVNTLSSLSVARSLEAAITVRPGERKPLKGAVQYNRSTCKTTSSGTWIVTVPPRNGDVTTGIESRPLSSGECPGINFDYGVIYYTWKSVDPAQTTDSLSATWRSPSFTKAYTFDIALEASPGAVTTFDIASPFRLGIEDKDLGNLDLSAILQRLPNLSSVAATGLTADSTSTAILLFKSRDGSTPIQFEATNGGQLLPFSSTFMKTKPRAAGTATLSVANELFQSGSDYVTAALLQAPARSTTDRFASPIVVRARQGTTVPIERTLELVPPPVILVHGLWGDRNSLHTIRDHLRLTPPWSHWASLVRPIEYAKNLPFDAKGPTAPVTMLKQAVDDTLDTLQNQGIVAGRVDVVAHSMGGLVTRHFTSLAGHLAPRNRMAGDLHVFVTLNTPHGGSALADFLLRRDIRLGRRQRGGVPGLVWDQLCDSPTQLISECFRSIGFPIEGASGKIETGAVYSLKPSGKSISRLKQIKLPPGTIWRATVTTAPNNSLLEYGLENLIAAVIKPSTLAPTIDRILGTTAHDVIVTTVSQGLGASSAQTVHFTGLAHTSAPVGGFTVPYIDASVYDDDDIKRLAECWLRYSGVPGICSTAATVAQGKLSTKATVTPYPLSPFPLTMPRGLEFAKPVELVLSLPSTAMAQLVLRQRDEQGRALREELPIVRRTGTTAYVAVVPKLWGLVHFDLTASFMDGGIARARASAPVGLPTTRPARLEADAILKSVHLATKGEFTGYKLQPEATFDTPGGSVAVSVEDSAAVVLATGSRSDVIAIDSDGTLHALEPGRVIVEVRFAGAVDRIPVAVEETPVGR